MGTPIEIDDAIVLLLGARVPGALDGEIKGITRLEKLIFLLERETSSSDWMTQDAEFEPYNFGPFSEKVYQAVDLLSSAGLVNDSAKRAQDDTDTWEQREKIGLDAESGNGQTRDPYTTRDITLTPLGWRYFEALTEEIPKDGLTELADFKKKFAFLPLRQLIHYVYSRYDSFTTKSTIRDDILGGRA